MRGLLLLVLLAVAIGWLIRTIRTEVKAVGRRSADRKDLERVGRAREREQEALREPGGSPDNPIPVTSPSVVEVEALTRRCARCEGALRLADHAAETIGGERLRVAHLVCEVCSTRRSVYFCLAQPS